MSPEAAAALTPDGVDRAIYGSIMTFVLEIFTITGTWTIKSCLLILYSRLTLVVHEILVFKKSNMHATVLTLARRHILAKQYLMVKIAAGYCVVTYLVVIFMFVFYWCSPTPEYWAVPVRIDQCATYYNHMIFATACNISSDILLLLIPIPIIFKTRLPTKRKIILVCILGLGVFNILAAILNRYYNFSNPNSYVFLYWYVAEVGIAMLVGNMPLCWPVFRTVFGGTETTDTPSYHGYTISGGGRKNKKPKNILSTTILGSTMWDKLDEQEGSGVVTQGSREQQPPSDQGSQIELVLQGHAQNHHHHAAVSANPEQTDRTHRSASLPSSSTGSSQQGAKEDKIVVVTTVDVSSTDSHK